MITEISKGKQITIPSEIRRKLNLNPGTKVEIEMKGKKIIIEPIEEDLEALFEEAKKTKPKFHLTVKQMDELVENEILG